MDGTVAIVDYESEYKKEDKVKYLNYLTGISNRYLKEKKDCPTLRMIVIYTGDIKRNQISAEYNIGAVKVTLEPAFLSELDSDRIFRHLKYKVAENEPLNDEELMELIILPLSYRKREEKEERLQESVKLATQLQDRGRQIFALAGILAFTDKIIDTETANKMRRAIEMTQVAKIFEEEKLQALAELEEKAMLALMQAKEEKRQALAKAEEENKLALAKAEEENRLALAKAEEENRLALAKAEEENKLALAKAEEENKLALAKAEEENKLALIQAEEEKKRADKAEAKLHQNAKEWVLKMLQKNYPSEEIASIVSVFSLDEIEAMRREMTEIS